MSGTTKKKTGGTKRKTSVSFDDDDDDNLNSKTKGTIFKREGAEKLFLDVNGKVLPLPVVNPLPEGAAAAILAAMSAVKPSKDFAEKGVQKAASVANFTVEDRADSYQCSIIRARRPLSSRFGTKITDLYDGLFKNPAFVMADEFPTNSYSELVELKQAYQVAKKAIPQMVTDRLEEIKSTSRTLRSDAGIKKENKCIIGPVESDPVPGDDLDNLSAHYTAYPPTDITDLAELDQMSMDVYGVNLSTLVAPFLFLYNNAHHGAGKIKSLLGTDKDATSAAPAAAVTNSVSPKRKGGKSKGDGASILSGLAKPAGDAKPSPPPPPPPPPPPRREQKEGEQKEGEQQQQQQQHYHQPPFYHQGTAYPSYGHYDLQYAPPPQQYAPPPQHYYPPPQYPPPQYPPGQYPPGQYPRRW